MSIRGGWAEVLAVTNAAARADAGGAEHRWQTYPRGARARGKRWVGGETPAG